MRAACDPLRMPGPAVSPRRRLLATLALAVMLAACSRPEPAQDEALRGAQLAGVMLDPQLGEISGLAASRRHADVLWMHDDGGNPERLFAVSTNGSRLATFRIEGVTKTDWEDIAAFQLDGRSYLLIADTGDNGGLRRTVQLDAAEGPANSTWSRSGQESRTNACAGRGRSRSAGPTAHATARPWPSTPRAGRSC